MHKRQQRAQVMTTAAAQILVGDIGGTYARFALLENGRPSPIESTLAAGYAGIEEALLDFLGRRGMQRGMHGIEKAIFAVAGPVENGRCVLTNSSWPVDAAVLQHAFAFPDVQLINDFEAIGWALPRLAIDGLLAIGGGKPVPNAPAAVIGPGTGLGLACFLPAADGAIVLATEGGHVTLPATSPREEAIIGYLRGRFGHASAERAVSGGGLENLYDAVRTVDGASAPARNAAEIAQAATAGQCPVSVAALDMFCAMLGTVAGNVALTLGARGGVYLGGGIVPRITDYLARSEFRARFEAKGRLRDYLSAIPTSVIVHPEPAFMGLSELAERQVRYTQHLTP
jgi:glucokinase